MAEQQEERLSLPRFQEALQRYKHQPSVATFWRWSVGIVPPQFRFLVEHPDVAEALAADARALAEQQAAIPA
jgi:hypothetical protein